MRNWSIAMKRAKAKKWSVEISKAVFAHLVLIGFPTIFFYTLRLDGWNLHDLHIAIATLYLFGAFVLLLESSIAIFRRFATDHYQDHLASGRLSALHYLLKSVLGVTGAKHPVAKRPVPRCSVLIAAYLPNEQDIILETIEHILLHVRRPAAGLELILAYNTPIDLAVEEDLRKLTQLYPELHLLRVEGSRSKAENLNAAFEIVTGEVTCILDADHHPAADCFERAWHWIEQGYDVVQGRSIIRNHEHNLLTQTIAIEFEMMYGIVHAAKSFLTDSSIFGGSNGYWRTSVLKQICFNPRMLTEDIDASIRTLLKGYRILHDRSIISTELAPMNVRSFWFQRKRWAQGWLEVGLKYPWHIWRSERFSLWQKFFWTYLLCYCEFYSFIAVQIVPLGLSLSLYHGSLPAAISKYLWLSTILSFVSGMYQTIATAKVASGRYPVSYYIKHVLLLIPFITFKNIIAVVGAYDLLRGNHHWLVTPRGQQHGYNSVLQKTALPATSSASIVNSSKQ